MKNFKYIMIAAMTAIMITSCEKEEGMTLDAESGQNSKSGMTNSNKSEDVNVEEVFTFIDAVSDDGISVASTSAEDAILYTEAALNWRLTNTDKIPSSSYIGNTEINVTVSEYGGELQINSSDIENMNTDLYNHIYNVADSLTLPDLGDGKYISVIDLSWEELTEGSNTINVQFVVNNSVSSAPSCNVTDYWKPIFNMGGCNNNTATTSDAGKEINMRVNLASCNSDIGNCTNPMWFNMTKTGAIDPYFYPQFFNDIWSDISYTLICLSPTTINNYIAGCENIGALLMPSGLQKKIRSIAVKEEVGSSSQGPFYSHTYTYYYGTCFQSVDSKPQPCFGC